MDPTTWALACVGVSVGSNTPKSDTNDAWGEGDPSTCAFLPCKEPPTTKLNLRLLRIEPDDFNVVAAED